MNYSKNNVVSRKLLGCLLFVGCAPPILADSAPVITDNSTTPRFVSIKKDNNSAELITQTERSECVFDKATSLTWEVKTSDGGPRDANQSYSWYEANPNSNGGFPGYRNRGKCYNSSSCDTAAYQAYVNKIKLCGRSTWRLPTREELRSLVNYQIIYPGPTIDKKAFPNTISQFYWSSTANANNKETAWGIGFSFGYDYAYFKSDHGYVRLVSGPD